MPNNKQNNQIKLVDISFDPKKVDCYDDKATIYGILVEKQGKKLVGKCDPKSKKDLLDAGKCD